MKTQIQLKNICRVIWVEPTNRDQVFLKKVQEQNFQLLLSKHFMTYHTMDKAFQVTNKQSSNFHVIVCSKDMVKDFIKFYEESQIKNVYHKCIVLEHSQRQIKELKKHQKLKQSYELVEQIYFIEKILLEIDKTVNTQKFKAYEFNIDPFQLQIERQVPEDKSILWVKHPNFLKKVQSNVEIQQLSQQRVSEMIMEPSQKSYIIIITSMSEQCENWLAQCQKLTKIILFDKENIESLYHGEQNFDKQTFEVAYTIQSLKQSIQRAIDQN